MKTYCFQYVGSIEVTESRGTQVCAEAFRKMKEVFKVVVISYFFQNLMKLKRGHKLKPFVIFNCLEFNNVSAIWFPLCMISELNIYFSSKLFTWRGRLYISGWNRQEETYAASYYSRLCTGRGRTDQGKIQMQSLFFLIIIFWAISIFWSIRCTYVSLLVRELVDFRKSRWYWWCKLFALTKFYC